MSFVYPFWTLVYDGSHFCDNPVNAPKWRLLQKGCLLFDNRFECHVGRKKTCSGKQILRILYKCQDNGITISPQLQATMPKTVNKGPTWIPYEIVYLNNHVMRCSMWNQAVVMKVQSILRDEKLCVIVKEQTNIMDCVKDGQRRQGNRACPWIYSKIRWPAVLYLIAENFTEYKITTTGQSICFPNVFAIH